jgi:hypothetical protein
VLIFFPVVLGDPVAPARGDDLGAPVGDSLGAPLGAAPSGPVAAVGSAGGWFGIGWRRGCGGGAAAGAAGAAGVWRWLGPRLRAAGSGLRASACARAGKRPWAIKLAHSRPCVWATRWHPRSATTSAPPSPRQLWRTEDDDADEAAAKRALTASGGRRRDAEFKIYPGAPHGFQPTTGRARQAPASVVDRRAN